MSNVIGVQPVHAFEYDGTQVNIFHPDKGQGIPRHDHPYSHATVVYAGRLLCTKENFRLEMTKETQPIVLKAGEWHELEAMEDGTVFSNIFAAEFMRNDQYKVPNQCVNPKG
jgi:quercetin dioxygenase-like cupin family protein